MACSGTALLFFYPIIITDLYPNIPLLHGFNAAATSASPFLMVSVVSDSNFSMIGQHLEIHKRQEKTEGWIKQNNEGIHNLYSSSPDNRVV
jgi:hypothetical protein